MRKATAGFLLLTPFLATAEWVEAPGCHVPDADHDPVMYDLVPHHGRYKRIHFGDSGVPDDAVYIELDGETALHRTGHGTCAVWVGVAGGEAGAPDARPYTHIGGREVEKTQSWTLRAIPVGGAISLRLMRTVSGPQVNCGMNVSMSVSKWCR